MTEQVAKISFSIKEVHERLIAFVEGEVSSNISQYIEVKQGQELARFELKPPPEEGKKGNDKKAGDSAADGEEPSAENSSDEEPSAEDGDVEEALDDEEVDLPEVFKINDEHFRDSLS